VVEELVRGDHPSNPDGAEAAIGIPSWPLLVIRDGEARARQSAIFRLSPKADIR